MISFQISSLCLALRNSERKEKPLIIGPQKALGKALGIGRG